MMQFRLKTSLNALKLAPLMYSVTSCYWNICSQCIISFDKDVTLTCVRGKKEKEQGIVMFITVDGHIKGVGKEFRLCNKGNTTRKVGGN